MKNSYTLFLAATIYMAPHASAMVGWWSGMALMLLGVIYYVKGD